MRIASTAFTNDGRIPTKFTCDGADISPPLEWSDVPPDAKTLTLICDDPDAPRQTFTHWVVFNRLATTGTLPEYVKATPELSDGSRQGKNDFGKVGYGGPCPPSGTHRYRFTLYALDAELELPAASTRRDVETAMKGHVLATAQLTGLFARSR